MMSTRVEKHLIRPSSPYFKMLAEFCHLAKNLYNHANYIIRQKFISTGEYVGYSALDKIMKADTEYPDYRAMPSAQSAQQVLRLLDKNWQSFFAAIQDWKVHKDKYLGRPKLPRYKKKSGLYVLTLTNQSCRLKGETIHFPRTFKGFMIKPKFIEKPFEKFLQVRFVPTATDIMLEIVYEVADVPTKSDNGIYASVDLGVDNLAAFVTNTADAPLLINGRPLKSVNQFYNKRIARLQSLCPKYFSRRMSLIIAKRNRQIEDYLHKASRLIVSECSARDVSIIVIGQNKNWKQGIELSKRVNQNFVQLPFAKFIQMIKYKAESKGITLLLTAESYTSGTSFLDGELPTKDNYDNRRRVHRGLFIANDGTRINADVNGAFQIMRKVLPNVERLWDRGCALQPVLRHA